MIMFLHEMHLCFWARIESKAPHSITVVDNLSYFMGFAVQASTLEECRMAKM